MIKTNIKIGDVVEYRREWGRGGYFEARIMNIEVGVPRQELTEVSWEEHEDAIFILNDGHWAQGRQIQAVIPAMCAYCGREFEDDQEVDRCECDQSVSARQMDFLLDQDRAARKYGK